ncbi:MAG: DUF116 domain-containing protein [Elusimicrobiota bacterium]
MNRWLIRNIWYPAIVFTGSFSTRLRERLEKSFVVANNKAVKELLQNSKKAGPKELLLLLPHCLQNNDCENRIIKTIKNCADCGKCRIAEINKVVDENRINTKVATGGRLARRWVAEAKPDIIIAVACERELCEGIFSTYPLPVVAIPNERPYGPCINTTVDVDRLSEEIRSLMNGRGKCP